MLLSVIIPSYNGASKLPNILSALEKQVHCDFEVIVVVDGSTDNTKELLDRTEQSYSLKVVYQTNQGRSNTRNNGAKEASGDILLFLDDDIDILPTVLGAHTTFHLKNENTILVGGIDEYATAHTDIQKYKAWLSERWQIQAVSVDTPYISAAHFSIPKKIFVKLGCFDSHLNDGEDFDLAVKAKMAGYDIKIDTSIIAYHHDPITCSSYIKRQRQYLSAHEELERLKPEIYKQYDMRKVIRKSGWKGWVFNFFAHSFWVKVIDKETWWIILLPKKVRYQIYDLVITGLGMYYPSRPISTE